MGRAGRKKREKERERQEEEGHDEYGGEENATFWHDRVGDKENLKNKAEKHEKSSSKHRSKDQDENEHQDVSAAEYEEKKADKKKKKYDEENEDNEGQSSQRHSSKRRSESGAHEAEGEDSYEPRQEREKGVWGWQPEGDVLSYMLSLEETLPSLSFDSTDDAELFVENVWKELGLEHPEMLSHMAQHKLGSQIIQALIAHGGPNRTIDVLNSLESRVERASDNPFGSRVLEDSFENALAVLSDEAQAKYHADMEKAILATADEIIPRWTSIMHDARGSFTLRAFLRLLAGRTKEDDKGKFRVVQVPKSFSASLNRLFDTISDASSLKWDSLARSSTIAPVIQLILTIAPRDSDIVSYIVRKLLHWEESASVPPTQHVHRMMRDRIASRTIEVAFKVLSPAMFQPLFHSCFQRQMANLLCDRSAGFALQHLISSISRPAHVAMFMDELGPLFEKIIFVWRSHGIIEQLAAACVRLASSQQQFVQSLLKAFDITTTAKYTTFLPSILSMSKGGGVPVKSGGDIVCSMASFDDSHLAALIVSVESTPPPTLLSWSQNGISSRAIEAIVVSQKIKSSVKTRLTRLALPNIVDMACSPAGSRLVESLFLKGDANARKELVRTLSVAYKNLYPNKFGRLVLEKCKVKSFQEQPSEWEEREEAKDRQKAKFESLLSEMEAEKPAEGTDERRKLDEKTVKHLGKSEESKKALDLLIGGGEKKGKKEADDSSSDEEEDDGKKKKKKDQKKEKKSSRKPVDEWVVDGQVDKDAALDRELFGRFKRKNREDDNEKDENEDGKKSKDAKKKRKEKKKEEDSDAEMEDADDDDAAAAAPQRKASGKADGLEFILDALAATKRKKKKSKPSTSNADSSDKSKKRVFTR